TNSKTDALGTLKLTLVKPTWNAGLEAPAAKICTRNGTDVAASIAICTLPMSDRVSLGESTSWYAARPATRAVRSTATTVVGSIAASAFSAAVCGSSDGAALAIEGPALSDASCVKAL